MGKVVNAKKNAKQRIVTAPVLALWRFLRQEERPDSASQSCVLRVSVQIMQHHFEIFTELFLIQILRTTHVHAGHVLNCEIHGRAAHVRCCKSLRRLDTDIAARYEQAMSSRRRATVASACEHRFTFNFATVWPSRMLRTRGCPLRGVETQLGSCRLM